MDGRRVWTAGAATIAANLLGVGAVTAETDVAAKIAALEQRLAAQQAELDQLRTGDDQNWLNERRAEEVKGLIREVLADADTRASLLQDGLTAGYDKGFFVASADGNYKLQVGVEAQVRYIYNTADQDTGDEDEGGFQLRRSRVDFRGNAVSPNLLYRLRIAGDRATGDADLELATIGYKFGDWLIQAGQFKPSFLREENVSGFRQLAAERSYLADYFTIDYTQGVELSYAVDRFRAAASIHDGSYGTGTEFNADRTDTAVNGRVEFLAAGDDFKQFDDFTSFNGDDFALLLGAGADYEVGEGGGAATPDLFKYTADISAEFGGANLFAAVYGQSFSGDTDDPSLPTALDDANQLGFVVQGGVFVVPDKFEAFARYEFIDFDGAYYRNSGGSTAGGTGDLGDDELSIITIGGNYYLQKHAAKLTVDLLYALDPVPVSNSGGGLVASPDEDQIAIRGQFQFSF